MSRAVLALGCALTLAGCAARRASGILVLRVVPADARVLLDGRYIGSGGALSGQLLRLDAGARRLELTAEGRYAARRDVDVPPGGRTELTVELHPIPEGERD